MSKQSVTQWWIGGLLAYVPAGILIPAAIVALIAHLDELRAGTDLHFVADAYSWTMVGLIAFGALFAIGGAVAQYVAWVGAVFNTRRLADRRWFHALFWSGVTALVTMALFGLGVWVAAIVLLAYLVAGPDGTALEPRATTPDKATITRWTGLGWATVGGGMGFGFLMAVLTRPGLPLHAQPLPALVLEGMGFSVAALGAVAVYAALCGAVVNAHHLADRSWYHWMLWGGIVATLLMPAFGIGALLLAVLMTVYVRSAPDGLATPHPPAPPAPVSTSRTATP